MFTSGLRTLSAIALGIGALILWAASPASADRFGDGDCDPATATCEVNAGMEEEIPGNAGDGNASDTAEGSAEGSGTAGDGVSSVPIGVCPNWAYELTDSESGFFRGASAGERPSDDHQLLGRWCEDPETGTVLAGAEWVLPGEDGAPLIDPSVLAQQAVDALRLPAPRIAASPEGAQFVGLATWLWLEDGSWEAQDARASVPGLTVTATAVPLEATWEMGEGTRVLCEGPGTQWDPTKHAPEDESECGHTYSRTSAGAVDGVFTVEVTVQWAVSWSGGGESGTEPGMTTTASTSWPVAQSQAVVQ